MQRRLEAADINKSLLALKECIRTLADGGSHVPYRASKLTLVLKDAFSSKSARLVMVATVSPGASCVPATLSTLQYAERLKSTQLAGVHAGSRIIARRVLRVPVDSLSVGPYSADANEAGCAAEHGEPSRIPTAASTMHTFSVPHEGQSKCSSDEDTTRDRLEHQRRRRAHTAHAHDCADNDCVQASLRRHMVQLQSTMKTLFKEGEALLLSCQKKVLQVCC